MFIVYILQSLSNSRYYIGHTDDLLKRLKRHNSGTVRSTKSGRPWKVVFQESFSTRSAAYQREMEIKRYKGGVQFKNLFQGK
jgi:putative endonuclease